LTAFDLLIAGDAVDTNSTAVVTAPVSHVEVETTEFPQYELSAYRWQQNGRKISKLGDGKVVRRQHWRCSNWDKPSKEKGCKAKFRIDITTDGPESEPIKSDIPHNHLPPPEKGRVDMETQFQMAVRPLKQQRETKDDGPTLYPTKRQHTDTSKPDSSQQWAALNAVMKLSETYGERFIRKVDFLPKLHAIFSSPESFEDMINHGESLFACSEFLPHLGLTLVVFSMLAEGVETDVLWMVSNSRDVEDYKVMLEYIMSISEGRFKPSNVVIGPDSPTLREAFAIVLPSSELLPTTLHTPASTATPPGTTSEELALVQPQPITPHSPITTAILQCLGR
jgi:hypothetical protein